MNDDNDMDWLEEIRALFIDGLLVLAVFAGLVLVFFGAGWL